MLINSHHVLHHHPLRSVRGSADAGSTGCLALLVLQAPAQRTSPKETPLRQSSASWGMFLESFYYMSNVYVSKFHKKAKNIKENLDYDILVSYRYRFHELAALRALMHAAQPLRENGDVMSEMECINEF